MGVKIPQTAAALTLPEGWHKAVIQDVQPDEGEFGPQLRWTFLAETGDKSPVVLTAWTSTVFNPRSKLYAWVEAVFGKPIPPDYDLDTDHLLGRPVDVKVVHAEGRIGPISKIAGLARAGAMTEPAKAVEDLPF